MARNAQIYHELNSEFNKRIRGIGQVPEQDVRTGRELTADYQGPQKQDEQQNHIQEFFKAINERLDELSRQIAELKAEKGVDPPHHPEPIQAEQDVLPAPPEEPQETKEQDDEPEPEQVQEEEAEEAPVLDDGDIPDEGGNIFDDLLDDNERPHRVDRPEAPDKPDEAPVGLAEKRFGPAYTPDEPDPFARRIIEETEGVEADELKDVAASPDRPRVEPGERVDPAELGQATGDEEPKRVPLSQRPDFKVEEVAFGFPGDDGEAPAGGAISEDDREAIASRVVELIFERGA